MSSVTRGRARFLLVVSSALVMVAGAVVGGGSATADSVWVQSYERSSQTAECESQAWEAQWQASWGTDSSWTPSWEQWANGGEGGWTCTRSITWARTPASSGSSARSYALGDVGPGGGLVFLISGGLTYEMARKDWSGAGTPDAGASYCDGSTGVSGAAGTAVGTGAANTAAMAASIACSSDAAAAVRTYPGGGFTDWFLPSQDELNAMCNYSRNPTTPPTGVCTGSQDGTFSTGTYGFASVAYWSSSQDTAGAAWSQTLDSGSQYSDPKNYSLRVRPVRAF